jgi:hypothetical protein
MRFTTSMCADSVACGSATRLVSYATRENGVRQAAEHTGMSKRQELTAVCVANVPEKPLEVANGSDDRPRLLVSQNWARH